MRWLLPVLLVVLAACTRSRPADTPAKAPASVSFSAQPVGEATSEPAWIADLTLADLDRDGRLDVVACESRLHRVLWLRQKVDGRFEERVISEDVRGPAHVEVVDFDGDGDADIQVASMGVITPNNERIGAVVILENRGDCTFTLRVAQENTYRVTDVRAGDLDGDGDQDLAVAKFGYLEGEVAWLENLGGWQFRAHALLGLSGAIHAPIVDVDGDGDRDIVALVSQDAEEVYCFDSDGRGNFTARVIHGSTNRDFGSSGLTVGDLDRDGDPDVVYTNGDGFDYATPGSRPWHGVQWLENDGQGRFTFHRLGSVAGAYSPQIVDLNGDGALDVVVSSAFNDWSKPSAVSLLWFENDGRQGFSPHVLAHDPTHLVVVKAADMNNDGAVDLVTGSLAFYPPFDRAARVTLWMRATKARSSTSNHTTAIALLE